MPGNKPESYITNSVIISRGEVGPDPIDATPNDTRVYLDSYLICPLEHLVDLDIDALLGLVKAHLDAGE